MARGNSMWIVETRTKPLAAGSVALSGSRVSEVVMGGEGSMWIGAEAARASLCPAIEGAYAAPA